MNRRFFTFSHSLIYIFLPISVLRPVANTTANALPVSAEVPAYNIEFFIYYSKTMIFFIEYLKSYKILFLFYTIK